MKKNSFSRIFKCNNKLKIMSKKIMQERFANAKFFTLEYI